MKSTTALVLLFQEHGFTLARAKNHPVWRCPCGHAQITTISTPAQGRSEANAKALIKRTRRACIPEKEATP